MRVPAKISTESFYYGLGYGILLFDFSFLVRGGRVNGVVGGVGALLHLIPIMMKTEDGRRLEKYAIARTVKKAVGDVIEGLKKK